MRTQWCLERRNGSARTASFDLIGTRHAAGLSKLANRFLVQMALKGTVSEGVRKKMESPQHCHSEAPAFGARNLFFFGILLEKQIPPPPRSEFGMTVSEPSAFFGSL